MKLSVILAGLLGLALAVGLVAYFGLGSILSSVSAIGWTGFVLFILWQMATFIPLGGAWFVVALGEPARRLVSFIWGRQVREGAADVLPFSPIGGMVVGVRAVVLSGVSPAVAYGSVAVDLAAEIIAQLVFVMFGLILLIGRFSRASLAANPMVILLFAGMALMTAGAVTVVLAQRNGLGAMDRLAARWLPKSAAHVHGANQVIADIYRRPARLMLSTLLHIVAWFSATFGSWIALRFMGAHMAVLEVMALESLVSALKSAAFFVPNAAGVQEGGFAMVGALFGLAPETAIALSLLRRARDIAIGVPTLLAWQLMEGRRLLRPPVVGTDSALEGGGSSPRSGASPSRPPPPEAKQASEDDQRHQAGADRRYDQDRREPA